MKSRFQFRLRTLLIGVTLLAVLCGYLAHEAKIVRERKRVYYKLRDRGFEALRGPDSIPYGPNWIRLALGDAPIEAIRAPALATDAEIREMRKAFPEARMNEASDFEKRIARGEAHPDTDGLIPDFIRAFLPVSKATQENE